MFYFIYLFSSIVLICNNFVNSNEEVRKFEWLCASEKCDTPISDVTTTHKFPITDHSAKLAFDIGSNGQVFKKPADESEFWFVQLGDKKGFIKKSHLREKNKLHSTGLFKVEGDNPFSDNNSISGATADISPTPPRIVDGTPIYDDSLIESDNNESFHPSNSADSTPHLDSKDIPESIQTQSTHADGVDQNKNGLHTGDDGSNRTLSPAQNESLSGVPSENGSDNAEGNISKTEPDSKTASDNDKVQTLGTAYMTPIDHDDDEEVEVSVEEEDEEYFEEPSDSPSSNSSQGKQTDPNILSGNVTQNDQADEKTPNSNTASPSETTDHLAKDKEPVDNSYTPPNNPDLKDSVQNHTPEKSSTDPGPTTTKEQPTDPGPTTTKEQPTDPGPTTSKEQPTPSRYINNRSSHYVVSHVTRNAPKNENSDSARNVQEEPSGNQLDPSKPLTGDQPDPKYGPTFQPPLNNAPASADNSSMSSPDNVHEFSTPSPASAADSTTSSPANTQDTTTSSPANTQDTTTSSPANTQDTTTSSPANTQDTTTSSPANTQDTTTSSPASADDSSSSSPVDAHDTSTSFPANVDTSTTPSSDNFNDVYTSTLPPVYAHDYSASPSYEPSTPPPKSFEDSEQNSEELDVSTVQPSVEEAEKETPSVDKEEEEGESSFSTESSNNLPHLESGSSLDNVSTEPPNVLSDISAEESPPIENEIQSIADDNSIQENKNPEDKTKDDVVQNIVENSQEQLLTGETPIRDSSGFYSSVSSFFSSLTELFNKSELPLMDQKKMEDSKPPTAPAGYCFDGDTCGGLERPIGGEDQHASHWSQNYPNVNVFKLNSVPLSFNSIMYICITSVVLLLFSLGYYYIDNSQNCSALVAKVNQLGQELFVTKKERDTLEDQLLKIKENCNMMDSSKLKQDSKLTSLQKALEESENTRGQLEEKVASLEKEVETLMEQGLEMHKLLSDTITDEDRSQMLLSNVDELKESLSEKLNEIVALTNQLDKKNEEIQLRQIDVRNANDRMADLERKLETCKADTEQSFATKLQDQQQKNIKLQKLLEEKGVSIARLENELAKTKAERDSAEARASSAEAGLQSAHSVGAGEARQIWLDSTAVRAALATAHKQNEALQQNISEINSSNKSLQDKISNLNEEISTLNLKYENVEKEKVNALTKLQVLSDYFKEKETKFQEELGVKESQWLQKETEDHTIYEQMKSLREEIASYKSQNDKLKAEILEQEASYKVQIANEEQKSYDHWVSLRQAERKVKELQMESAHFRNRLTQIETANQSSTEALNPNGLDKSSFSAPSPPFMMLPPLPASEFFPLPPPPIHPTASRPPPLGRISSPQLPGEMIPPPPLVPFDMFPPPPSSTPPPPLPLYKPQPRDRPQPPKDSPPSNYSSESVNDKPPRRRRR